MEYFLKELRSLLHSLVHRLSQLIAEAPACSLQITGVLGLAATLYGVYHFQGPARGKRDLDSRGQQREGGTTGEASSSGLRGGRRPEAAPASKARQREVGKARSAEHLGSNLSWAVRSQLSGVKAVTISAPGVLLEEQTTSELQEAATLKQDAAKVLREILQVASVYLVTQVEDDTGEATCRGALEAGGLVGTGACQIPPHRLLFCSTLDGKVSIVRQLEPQLHIDGHAKTVEDLKRFIKLVHIRCSGTPGAGRSSPNVGYAESLADLFAAQ